MAMYSKIFARGAWRATVHEVIRGVRPRLEGKPRTPLSSRFATRVSWSPLSVIQGGSSLMSSNLTLKTLRFSFRKDNAALWILTEHWCRESSWRLSSCAIVAGSLQFHSSFSRLLWLFEVFCISIQIVKLFVPAL